MIHKQKFVNDIVQEKDGNTWSEFLKSLFGLSTRQKRQKGQKLKFSI